MSPIDYDEAFRGRISAVIEMLGGVKKAAEIAETASDQVARWRDGKSRPAFFPLAKLCAAANVSVDWLARGGSQTAPALTAEEEKNDDFIVVPMATEAVSAGHGLIFDDLAFKYFAFSKALLRRAGITPEKAEFVRVRGDSMEPTLKDGDVVFMDRSKNELSGEAIYVISLGAELRVKRVHKGIDGTVTLISDNAKFYPPEKLSRSDAENLVIHGRVFSRETLL